MYLSFDRPVRQCSLNNLAGFILLCTFVTSALAANSTVTQLQPVQLEITTHLGDGQSFVQGDSIRFMISLDRSAYVALFYQDSSSRLVQLLPNRYRTDSFLKAGLFIPFPDRDDRFELSVQAPFGTDRVWAYASDVPISNLNGDKLENGLTGIDDSIDQVRAFIKHNSKFLFDEALLTLHTAAK